MISSRCLLVELVGLAPIIVFIDRLTDLPDLTDLTPIIDRFAHDKQIPLTLCLWFKDQAYDAISSQQLL